MYDQVNARLYDPEAGFELPLDGRARDLRRGSWRRFIEYAGIEARFADEVLDRSATLLVSASDLVERSYLDADLKSRYRQTLEQGVEDFAA